MKALKYAWGLPVAAVIFWLGTLVQGEQPGEVARSEWQEKVDAELKTLSTRQENLELRLRELKQAPGADVAAAIREQALKVTTELKNMTDELRQLRRVR
jgi:hypothetical protein